MQTLTNYSTKDKKNFHTRQWMYIHLLANKQTQATSEWLSKISGDIDQLKESLEFTQRKLIQSELQATNECLKKFLGTLVN